MQPAAKAKLVRESSAVDDELSAESVALLDRMFLEHVGSVTGLRDYGGREGLAPSPKHQLTRPFRCRDGRELCQRP